MLVCCFIFCYSLVLAWLSLTRHAAQQTNALDLGYYDNTIWHTSRGHPFRFTTFHDAAFAFPEFDPNAVSILDNLLAFHVEPLLLLIAPLYWLWPDARMLLILQAVVVALGAWPAYQIALRNFQIPRVPADWSLHFALIFPLLYLLSPSLIGASLSDFHPVTLCASFFLFAYDALERRAYKAYFVWLLLIVASKEDMGLVVTMWGVYQLCYWLSSIGHWIGTIVMRQMQSTSAQTTTPPTPLRIAFITLCLGIGATLNAWLIQRIVGGRDISAFASRYSWLGNSAPELLQNVFTTPLLLNWFTQPEVYGYLLFLLAQVGFIALLAPEILLIALPSLAINTLSAFDWMRSGVAHYSAPIVPWLIIATIIGMKRSSAVFAQVTKRWKSRFSPQKSFVLVPLLILTIALAQTYRAGQLPFTRGFEPYTLTAHHHKLAEIIAQIPPSAKLSAQSALYPHVSARADAYLFPTASTAEYFLLDVTSDTYPISALEYAETVQRLINQEPSQLIVAADGYLLLKRGPNTGASLPASFFDFARGDARGDARAIQHPLRVRFGDALELLGYDLDTQLPRHLPTATLAIRTYWRALHPLNQELRFVHQVYAPQGHIRYAQIHSPTELWYPTTRWRAGETMIVEQRRLPVERGGRLGLSVEHGDKKAPVIERPQTPDAQTIERGKVLLLTSVQ